MAAAGTAVIPTPKRQNKTVLTIARVRLPVRVPYRPRRRRPIQQPHPIHPPATHPPRPLSVQDRLCRRKACRPINNPIRAVDHCRRSRGRSRPCRLVSFRLASCCFCFCFFLLCFCCLVFCWSFCCFLS